MSPLLGAVLAGGEGRRMGGRKESLHLDGRPLLSRAWNALAPLSPWVLLQGCATAPAGLEASPDLREGQGPLAGLETALRRAGERGAGGAVVLAVDLPRVDASILLALARRWRESEVPEETGVVLEGRDGIQPLAGVYGADLGPRLSGWLDGTGRRAVREWIGEMGDRIVPVRVEELAEVVGHPEPLLNLNTPGEMERALVLPPVTPPLVTVVGWKDSGKTSVAVALVQALRNRGYRVMALKHGHGFRLDTPGTDSHRLRTEGGAERVVLAGPRELALLGGWGPGGEEGAARLAARFLSDAQIVVVEGWKGSTLPAVEVRRCGAGEDPPLWKSGAVDRDRYIARILRGCGEGPVDDGGPPSLEAGDPGLGRRLAEVVETRIIPGWRS